jgi:hypothetical protein
MKSKDRAKEVAINPLVTDGSKLIPSVTRVFGNHRTLYVYLHGYEPGITAATPLISFVSFYRNQSIQFQSQPIAVTPEGSGKLRTAPLLFSIELDHLSPGEYQ